MKEYTKACIPEIEMGTNKMTAKLRLQLDETGQELTVKDLKDWLMLHDVKAGIMEEAIEDMIEHDIYDVYVEIARGKESIKGKDGYYIFHVSNPETIKGPKILEDGSVEYTHTEEYTIVEEGDLLAEYVPPTNGIYGYTVENKVQVPVKGKGIPQLRGKGFRIEEGKYYAAKKGKADVTENGIYITDLLEIKGDVDINSGHIDFKGNVNIRGDVHSGMTVKAEGDIEIKGHVGNCIIEAGGNITINKGMQGKFAGRLKAGKDINCKFFENASAEAKGNIYVRSVLHSKLEAEGKIKVEGRESVVLGGSLYAVQGIELSEAGNLMEVPTTITVGVLPKTLSRIRELDVMIKKVEEDVSLLERVMETFKRVDQSKMTKENKDWRKKIIQAKVMKATELKQYRDEKIQKEALINSGKEAQIVIQNTIFPGCRVEIAGVGMDIKEQLKYTRFVLKDGNIETILLY